MAADIYVALLRAINVGGNNPIAMAELRTLFEEMGCTNVRTYIQSGNVVFRAPKKTANALAVDLERAIHARFGWTVPVVVRTAAELRAAIDANPFVKAGAPVGSLHVSFMSEAPAKALVDALDPERSPGDAFAVRGREIYLSLPNGAGRSKLTSAYFDAKLKAKGTARNWRTILKLAEMTEDA